MRTERPSFLGNSAIAGVGYTDISKRSGRSVATLATAACRAALEDCGLTSADVDGVVSFGLFNDSVGGQAVATELAIPELTYCVDLTLGGQAAAFAVTNAAMAVHTGLASCVLVYRALNGRSGIRIGTQPFAAPTAQYRYPIGFTAYPYYMAMLARRFMVETGAATEDLAAVVLAQREYATRNQRAILRTPLTLDDYLEAPFLVEPFRTVDCTTEVDGACAVVVTTLERARTLRQTPVVLEGAAWATGRRSGLDIADLHLWPDFTTNAQNVLADRLWRSAGLHPDDVDVAEIYDCFSSSVLIALEGLGFAGRGESGAFVQERVLPVNTHGGLLCEGYVHGMNTLCEGVLQLQGRCDERQVEDARVCVVTSGAMGDGSAAVLVRDDA